MNKTDNKDLKKDIRDIAKVASPSKVAHWLATDEGQEVLSRVMDDDFVGMEHGGELYIDSSEIPSDKMYKQIMQRVNRHRLGSLILRVAAVLIPFIFITGLYWMINSRVDLFGKEEYTEIYVPKGEQLQMAFQDGSKVFLNSDTKLKYPRKFGLGNRRVYLEGEGYFIVEKNPDRPFVVSVNGGEVKVLGTSFNVNAYPGTEEVTLLLDKGMIDWITPSQKNYAMKPGDKLVYNLLNGKCTIFANTDAKELTGWKNDIIIFRNTSLESALNTLQRWFNVKFTINDTTLLKYSFTLESGKSSLDEILNEMEKVSPIQFIPGKDTITVSHK